MLTRCVVQFILLNQIHCVQLTTLVTPVKCDAKGSFHAMLMQAQIAWTQIAWIELHKFKIDSFY